MTWNRSTAIYRIRRILDRNLDFSHHRAYRLVHGVSLIFACLLIIARQDTIPLTGYSFICQDGIRHKCVLHITLYQLDNLCSFYFGTLYCGIIQYCPLTFHHCFQYITRMFPEAIHPLFSTTPQKTINCSRKSWFCSIDSGFSRYDQISLSFGKTYRKQFILRRTHKKHSSPYKSIQLVRG